MEKTIYKHEYDERDGVLRVYLEGQINASNAAGFEEELTALRQACPQGRLVFDMDRLGYISSMGLRVLLKLGKTEKDRMRAVNASADVMEIFRMTGFNSLIDISQKMRTVSTEGCEIIGRGANGTVYRLDRDTIIKVFRPDADLTVIERERAKAQAALLKGLPTAISYDVVRVGDSCGIVFELIDSKSLAAVMREDEAHFDRYAKAYTSLFRDIHNTEGDEEIFGSIKKIYEEAIDYCGSEYTPQELGQLRALIESVPDRGTLIHGDYHPKNIMLIGDELTLIDMGDMSMGDPVFDFLATAATQVNLVKLDPVFAEKFTGMPAQMVARLWNALLEGCFGGKTGAEIEQIDRRIAVFSKLKVALAPYFARDIDEKVIRASIEDARANLFPVIDELCGKGLG